MLFQEELAIMDYNTSINMAREEGEAKGEANLKELFTWLYENGRDDDVKKATLDTDYCKKLFEEYKEINTKTN